MAQGNRPPPVRRTNVIGSPPPARRAERWERRRDEVRSPLAAMVDDRMAIVGSWVTHRLWTESARALWRWRDISTGPTVFAVVALLDWAAGASSAVGLLASVWCGITIGFGGWDRWHRAAAAGRDVHQAQKELHRRLVPTPKVLAVQHRDHCTIITTKVAPGLDPAGYEAQEAALAASWGCPVVITKPTPGKVVIRLERVDLLADVAPWVADPDPDPRRVPIGRDWDGKVVTAPLPDHAWLVAGVRGSGKSAFLNGVCARIVACENVELYVVDPVDGIDLGVWHPFAERVAESTEAGIALLEHMEALRKSRVAEMRRAGVQIARWPRWPLRVLVIDELADLTTYGTPKQQKATEELLRGLVAKGRKSGDVVISATQHPSAEVLPTLVRAQHTHVLGLRVGRSEQSNVIFGQGAKADGWDLSEIDAAHKGRGIWSDGSSMTPIRTFGLWGSHLRQVARSLAPDLPEYLPEPTEHLLHDKTRPDSNDLTPPLPELLEKRVERTLLASGPAGITTERLAFVLQEPRRTVGQYPARFADQPRRGTWVHRSFLAKVPS